MLDLTLSKDIAGLGKAGDRVFAHRRRVPVEGDFVVYQKGELAVILPWELGMYFYEAVIACNLFLR